MTGSPVDVAAVLERGAGLERAGDWRRAAACYDDALRAGGEHPAVLDALARVFARVGRRGDAIALLERATRLAPGDAVLHNNLGNVLNASGQSRPAMRAYERALQLAPDYANAHFNAGMLMEKAARPEAALAHFETVVRLHPDDAEAWNAVGLLRHVLGDDDGGAAALERALAATREPQALVNMGNAHLAWGRGDDAVRLFERALELAPRHVGAWQGLSRARRFGADDRPLLERLRRLAGEPSLAPRDRAALEFALGKMLDDAGEYDAAFACVASANALRRAEAPFDRARFDAVVDGIVGTFDGAWLRRHAAAGEASDLPVFVVGMMRSGTTLVEQVLAAHPEVVAGGEMGTLGMLAASFPAPVGGRGYPWAAASAGDDLLRRLGRAYLDRLPDVAAGIRRVTDKMTSNYLHLGLVAAALPGASLVECRRDPVDTCLSVFFQSFVDGNDYSYDLLDIAHVQRACRRVMAHWHAVMPGRIHVVRYEDLVADLEPHARALIGHCGLAWDERCLAPGAARRVVETASVAQVRAPVHRGSVARWRRYERHLGPLLEALGA